MRDCGECDVCCVLAEVIGKDFHKKGREVCKFLNQNEKIKKCLIYENRPKMCENYFCSWARYFGEEVDRPDLCGVMIFIGSFNGGTWIFAMENRKDAAITTGKNVIIDVANKTNLPVIVSNFNSLTESDFGNRVIIHKNLIPRSKNLVKDFLGFLDEEENFNIFNLRVN